MNNPLKDKEFLKQMDNYFVKETFAKIITLDNKEQPLEEIQGKTISGNINIDGNSAVRRTFSVQVAAQDLNITDYYWGLKTKVKLEIGLKNYVNDTYPQIIWFPQGIFVLTSFSTSIANNSYQISLSGKDKMCLLDGSLGGSIPSETDFGQEEIIDENDNVVKKSIPIKRIIKELVHIFGQEPYHNIIINDLEIQGKSLVSYQGEDAVYGIFTNDNNNKELKTVSFDGGSPIYNAKNGDDIVLGNISLNWTDPIQERGWKINYYYHNIFNPDVDNTVFTLDSNESGVKYVASKHTAGDVVGYMLTDLTYPGELVSKAGESVTSILDKIKKTFGDFEYFYNLEGQFVFQRVKTYTNLTWNNMETSTDNDTYIMPAMYTSPIAYKFEGNTLLHSISSSLKIDNVKNDFSIWGQRKTAAGATVPIHYRVAIQTKPISYKSYDEIEYLVSAVDWRELIYQMAVDHLKHGQDDDYLNKMQENNSWCFGGKTGFEAYYTDLLGFWRDIYDGEKFVKEVQTAPDLINFWFDFIEPNLLFDFAKFSVDAIGNRTKVVNDNAVGALDYKDELSALFVLDQSDPALDAETAFIKIQVPEKYQTLFSVASQSITAQDKLNELLYLNTNFNESVNLTTVPIYYLEPNRIIQLQNEDIKISGDYIVNKITLPLTYNGTMSLSVSKVIKRVF